MKRTKAEKKRLRVTRWRRLRFKRYKGDHDYCMRLARCPEGFTPLPFPIVFEPGVPIGLYQGPGGVQNGNAFTSWEKLVTIADTGAYLPGVVSASVDIDEKGRLRGVTIENRGRSPSK